MLLLSPFYRQGKLSHREVEQLAPDNMTKQWWNWDSNSGDLVPEPVYFNVCYIAFYDATELRHTHTCIYISYDTTSSMWIDIRRIKHIKMVIVIESNWHLLDPSCFLDLFTYHSLDDTGCPPTVGTSCWGKAGNSTLPLPPQAARRLANLLC